MPLTVVQVLPALEAGEVERSTLEVAQELCRRGHRAIVISAGGRLVAELEAAGARHVTWAIGRKTPLTLHYVRPLRQLLLSERVDVLHARSRLPAWIAYLAWRRMDRAARPNFLTTVHGPYTVNRYSRIMTRGERVIAISSWIRDYILENYPNVEASKIALIPRGIDPTQYPHGHSPAEEWQREWRQCHPAIEGRYVITLPARVTRWKGHRDFITVIGRLKQEGVRVHGLIAGGAEPRRRPFLQELKSIVSAQDLVDDVTFLGQREDMREVMAVSDAVVSLTREPEAFGRTAIEALALGVPVVGYDHGGTAEILRAIFPQGLVPVGDTVAAASRLAEFARARPAVPVQYPFTLARMLNATLDLYESLGRPRWPS
ncbi:MAG: glycosyltransferase family 4 protein [Chromatiales bacterium]